MDFFDFIFKAFVAFWFSLVGLILLAVKFGVPPRVAEWMKSNASSPNAGSGLDMHEAHLQSHHHAHLMAQAHFDNAASSPAPDCGPSADFSSGGGCGDMGSNQS